MRVAEVFFDFVIFLGLCHSEHSFLPSYEESPILSQTFFMVEMLPRIRESKGQHDRVFFFLPVNCLFFCEQNSIMNNMRNKDFGLKINGSIIETAKKRLNKIMIIIISSFLLIFSGLVITANKMFDCAVVEGLSMYPSINATWKTTNVRDIAYFAENKNIRRGDIIIADYYAAGVSEDENLKAIKRLIAVGGDTICYYNGHILLNGEVLKETYIETAYEYLKKNPRALMLTGYHSANEWKEKGYTRAKEKFEKWCKDLVDGTMLTTQKNTSEFFKNFEEKYSDCIKHSDALDTYVLTVPDNFVFFVGDNRKDSQDCNNFGPIEKKYVLAKVCFLTTGEMTNTGIITKKILHMFD